MMAEDFITGFCAALLTIAIIVLISALLTMIIPKFHSRHSKIEKGDVIIRKSLCSTDNPFIEYKDYKLVIDVKMGSKGKYIKYVWSDKNGKILFKDISGYSELYDPSDYKIVNHIEL